MCDVIHFEIDLIIIHKVGPRGRVTAPCGSVVLLFILPTSRPRLQPLQSRTCSNLLTSDHSSRSICLALSHLDLLLVDSLASLGPVSRPGLDVIWSGNFSRSPPRVELVEAEVAPERPSPCCVQQAVLLATALEVESRRLSRVVAWVIMVK